MKNKNSFILYHSYSRHFEMLTDDQVGRLIRAIFKYSEEGVEPKLDQVSTMAFNFIKEDIDINKMKYDVIVERNRKNGAKGGRPKKPSRLNKNPRNPVGKSITQGKSQKPKKADNGNDSEIVSESDIDILDIRDFYNEIFKKRTTSVKGFVKNFSYWRKVHELEKIRDAIKNARQDKFWKDKLTLTILFRTKNTQGEDVDYIEDLFNRQTTPKGGIAIL